MNNEKNYGELILSLLTISNQIKLYHWQTLLNPRHTATDQLYLQLNILIDQFIETLTGRLIIENKNKDYRIKISDNAVIKIKNLTDDLGNNFIKKIKDYLESDAFSFYVNKRTDLQNIRDEMLSLVNTTSYLFSLT